MGLLVNSIFWYPAPNLGVITPEPVEPVLLAEKIQVSNLLTLTPLKPLLLASLNVDKLISANGTLEGTIKLNIGQVSVTTKGGLSNTIPMGSKELSVPVNETQTSGETLDSGAVLIDIDAEKSVQKNGGSETDYLFNPTYGLKASAKETKNTRTGEKDKQITEDSTGENMVVAETLPPKITYSDDINVKKNTPVALSPNNKGSAITSCDIKPNLPTGLTLSNTTCKISGTPTKTSSSNAYTVTANNTAGSGTATLTIRIRSSSTTDAPNITYDSNISATKDVIITTLSPTNTGDAATSCEIAPERPTGLSLSATCAISGTATVLSESAEYTVTATNSAGSDTATLTIEVVDAVPDISYASSISATKNVAIESLAITNPGGTIISCAIDPALPAGLSLSDTCTISGTPTAAAASGAYTVTATNTGGNDTASVTIVVVLPTYSIGGTVSGLNEGESVVLQNNGADDETVSENAAFTFDTEIDEGTEYTISVLTQPDFQTCTVSNATGEIAADVTNVSVSCSSNLTFFATAEVNGDSVGDRDTADARCAALIGTEGYPTAAICPDVHALLSFSAADDIADFTSVYSYPSNKIIASVDNTKVGDNFADILDESIDSSVADANITTDDYWTYSDADGTYEGRNCTADEAAFRGSSSFSDNFWLSAIGADCTNINEATLCLCNSVKTYQIGGTLSGLGDDLTVTLQNNASDDITLSANGSYRFVTELADDAEYEVTVSTQPDGQTCTVSNGDSAIDAADVSNINIACEDNTPVITMFSVAYSDGGTPTNTQNGTAVTDRDTLDELCSTAAVRLDLSCPNNRIRAFISLADDDEIRDMPTNYSYSTDVAIKGPDGTTTIADNWTDLLDGSIDATLFDAGVLEDLQGVAGFLDYFWTYSDSSGALNSAENSNCVTGTRGEVARGNSTSETWLDGGFASPCADINNNVACLCE